MGVQSLLVKTLCLVLHLHAEYVHEDVGDAEDMSVLQRVVDKSKNRLLHATIIETESREEAKQEEAGKRLNLVDAGNDALDLGMSALQHAIDTNKNGPVDSKIMETESLQGTAQEEAAKKLNLVDAGNNALELGTIHAAEANVTTKEFRKATIDDSISAVDPNEDARSKSIQWTRRIAVLGLAGILLGLLLPGRNCSDARKPSGPSANDVPGDTGASPAIGTHGGSVSKESETGAAPCNNQSAIPPGEDKAEVLCSPQTPSAGEHLLTTNREQEASPVPIEELSPQLRRLGVLVVQQKWKVIFFWAVLCLAHVPLAAQIQSIMTVNFRPTPQMLAYEAHERFRLQFPNAANGAEFCLILQSTELEAYAPIALQEKEQNAIGKNTSLAVRAPLCIPGSGGRCNAGDCCKPEDSCAACPHGFMEENGSATNCESRTGFRRCNVMRYAQIKQMPGFSSFSEDLRKKLNTSGKLIDFLSASTADFHWGKDINSMMATTTGNVALLQFRISDDTLSKEAQKFAKRAHSIIDQLLRGHLPKVTFTGLLGVPEFINNSIKSAEETFVIMDCITLPVATFLLWWVLRGYRLIVSLLCTMVVSSSCVFGVLYIVGVAILPIDTLTPEVVMSILIAMNIDYALFLKNRFRSEVLSHKLAPGSAALQTIADEATVAMLASAGFTVMTSGTMLWLVFTSLIYFPFGAVKSLGYGCAICLMFTIAVNMTLVPAMLSAFPKFFTSDFLNTGRAACNEQVSPFDWVWKCLARKTTAFPNNLILASSVLVLCGGVGIAATRMRLSSAFAVMMPRHGSSATAYKLMQTDFGWGTPMPVDVLLEPAENYVLSPEFWNASQRILHDIHSRWPGGPDAIRIHSVSYVDGEYVPWRVADICLHRRNPLVRTTGGGAADAGKALRREAKLNETCRALQFLHQRYVNEAGTATYAQIFPRVDPLGSTGDNVKWLDEGRKLASHWQEASGVRVTWTGYVVEMDDIKNSMWSMIPVELLVIVSTVLILGVAFRSAIVPLRSIITILANFGIVYGSAVLVYQDGVLDFLGIPGMHGGMGAVNFMPPVCALPICAGICLDYDVFLITHISEYRAAGCSPNRSISAGLCNSGGIITAAGLIMTVGFSGHIAADLEGLNAFGFFMVVTVLFDTFIMRPILTPALMSLLGRYNWWPGPLFYMEQVSSQCRKKLGQK